MNLNDPALNACAGVTLVGLAAPSAFTVSNSPVTSSGVLTLGWGTGKVPPANLGFGTPNATNFLRGDGQWITLNTPRGTVTSVALGVPTGFTITGSPITASGTLNIGWDATTLIPLAQLGTGAYDNTKFLRGDGTWATPPTATGGTVTSFSVNANATPLSFTVNAPMTTPMLNVSWGTGQIPVANLGSETPSATTYLRGDGEWSPLPVPTLDFVLDQGNTSARNITLSTPSILNANRIVAAAASVSATPTSPTDVVRLSDLQNAQRGLTFKSPVAVVAVGVSVGTTYDNTAGTITGTAPLTIDGVTLAVGQRVLLTAQSALTGAALGISNGAYTVSSNSGSFVLTRASDSLVPAYGDYYFVTSGTLNANTSYVNTNAGPVTVGTTPITYAQFSASAQAGSALPLADGVASAGVAVQYARQDHIHPFSLTTVGTGGLASYNSTSGVLNVPASNIGTLSSVGLANNPSTSALFAFGNSPLTTNGVITIGMGTGQIPVANLGAGTPSASTYLAGNGLWTPFPTLPTGTVTDVGVSPALASAFQFTTPDTTPVLTIVGSPSITQFLRGDGIWATPVDTSGGTVTQVSVGMIADPFALAIANPTTTPTISLAWVANRYAPQANLGTGGGVGTYLAGTAGTSAQWTAFPQIVSDVTFTGAAANAFAATPGTNNVRQISFNNVSAPASQFLRGDGQWVAPTGTGTGTVTSVGLTSNAAGLVVTSGSPITTSGNINLGWGTAQIPAANLGVIAGGTSSPGAGTYLAGTIGTTAIWQTLPNPGAGTLTGITGSSTANPLSITISNANPAVPAISLAWGIGQIPVATLGAGTPSSATYLTGDGIWTTIPPQTTGTVTQVSVAAQASPLQLAIGTPTTTPSLTFTWGTGQIPVGNLGAGLTTGSRYLASDGTWTLFPPIPLGTVTSIGMTVPSFLSVSPPAITNSGTFAIGYGSGTIPVANLGTGTAGGSTYLAGDGTWQPYGGGTGTGVTRVEMTVPSGLSVSGTPITTTGTLALTWGAGQVPRANIGSGTPAAGQYVDGGTGAWTPLPAGTVSSISITTPSALQVTPATITTSGTFAFSWGSGQVPVANLGTGTPSATTYLNGLGQWNPLTGGGSVTSVGLSLPAPFSVTTTTVTTAGTLTAIWGSGQIPVANLGSSTASSSTYLRGDGAWAPLPASGTVTSVGMTVPAGFAVSPSAITSSGTFALSYSGLIPTSSLGTGTATAATFLAGNQTWTAVPPPTLNEVLTAGNTSALGANLGSLTVSGTPTNPTDVVRLVDFQTSQLLNYKNPVRYVATTSIGTTYVNNTGVSTATITGTVPLIIDGVTLTSADIGQRVLLTDQGALSGTAVYVSNGVYTVTLLGGTNFQLTRTADVPAYGNYFFVTAGTVHDFTSWVNNTTGSITVGATPITYIQFFAAPDAATSAPLASGIATLGTSTRYAREDHIHPLSLTTTGSGLATYNSTTGVLNIPASSGGSVTSVALSIPDPFQVAITNPSTTPSIAITFNPSNAAFIPPRALGGGVPDATKYLAGNSSWLPFPTLTNGTVTSVGLSLPTPFNVTTPTVTTAGNLTAVWGTGQIPAANLGAGTPTATKYLAGDGNWTAFPTINSGTVTAVSVTSTAAPLNFNITNPNTTPQLVVAWGSGQIPVNNLGGGTPAATKYLAGDGVWTPFPTITSGTVTSVTVAVSAPLQVTNPTVTSSGTINIAFNPLGGQIPVNNLGSGSPSSGTYLNGLGQWTPFPTIGTGTVTSVGLTAPAPLVASSIPVTSTGNLSLTWGTGQIPTANIGAGSAVATSYLNGLGVWTPFPTINAGTVTSVSLTMPTGFTVSTTNPSTTPSFVVEFSSSAVLPPTSLGTNTPTAGKYLAGNGQWTPFPTLNAGTVTSVDMSLPSAFSLSGNPITSAGTFAVTWGSGQVPVANLATGIADATKYLAGNGQWTPLPAAGTGTVTSVAMTVPNSFSLGGNPITTSGTFALTWGTGQVPVANLATGSATAANFVNGLGQWAPAVTNFTTTIAGFAVATPNSTPALSIAAGQPSGSYLESTGNFSVPPFVDPIPFAIALG